MEYPDKYLLKILPEPDDMPTDEPYIIRTDIDIDLSFIIPAGEYVDLRNILIAKLSTFYDRLSYKDAGQTCPYLNVQAQLNDHCCIHVFYIEEWYKFKVNNEVDIHLTKYLERGKMAYERSRSRF